MYTKLVTEGLVNYTYQQCPEADTTSDLVQFTLAELGGPMIFLVVTSVLSMLITRIGRSVQRRTEALKNSIDVDGDGVVTRKELAVAMAQSVHLSKPKRRSTVAPPTRPAGDATWTVQSMDEHTR